MTAQILPFPRKRVVCPLSESLARLRLAELAMERAADEAEAIERRVRIISEGGDVSIAVRGIEGGMK